MFYPSLYSLRASPTSLLRGIKATILGVGQIEESPTICIAQTCWCLSDLSMINSRLAFLRSSTKSLGQDLCQE
jgi:hypothetical protein